MPSNKWQSARNAARHRLSMAGAIKRAEKKIAGSKIARFAQRRYRYPRPVRYRQGSVRLNRKAMAVVNNLVKVGVLELKQSQGTPFNEQALVTRCQNNIQYVNFSPVETGYTDESTKVIDLVTLSQGVGSNAYVGKYINVKKAFMRFHISVPMIDEGVTSALNNFKGMTERHLRVMLVAPKLTSQPANTTLTTQDSLFLDYGGEDYGLADSTDKPSWEILQAPINKKNWVVLKDQHYKVSPNRIDTYDSNSRPALKDHNLSGETYYSASWNESHSVKLGGSSELNINCNIPINKKVEMNTTTHRPENLNMGYRFIVISSIPGMKQADQKTTNNAAYGSNRVLVSSRSFLQYHDA